MEESKPIEQHHENTWDAPVEDDDAERKVSTQKEETLKENSKPIILEVKEVFQKDKYGNILITSLGDYKEPPKLVKGARATDMNRHDNYSLFRDALTHESDDEEVKESVVLDEIMNINSKQSNKNKKGKKGENLNELDDLLKELGVEHKPKEEVKKVKKEKENKPKEVKEENAKNETQGNTEKENDDKEKGKKKPAVEKKPQVKSHLNDAKREIKEKQEALKKKDKKKGI